MILFFSILISHCFDLCIRWRHQRVKFIKSTQIESSHIRRVTTANRNAANFFRRLPRKSTSSARRNRPKSFTVIPQMCAAAFLFSQVINKLFYGFHQWIVSCYCTIYFQSFSIVLALKLDRRRECAYMWKCKQIYGGDNYSNPTYYDL